MIRSLLIPAALAALALTPASVRSQDSTPRVPSKVDPARVVGRVLGKPVTAGDIGMTEPIDPGVAFDARDSARWELMGRISGTLGGPILERFAAERGLDPTPEEVARWRRAQKPRTERSLREAEARLRDIDAALATANLAADQRPVLAKQRESMIAIVEAQRALVRDGSDEDTIRMFVVPWKFERELHRRYGGRVIFQQFGPEALDARRRLFEEAEARGDLVLDDPGVRHLFNYYGNMRHTVIFDGPGDSPASPFARRPWFFEVPGPGDEPKPGL